MLTWCFFVLFVFGENRQPLCLLEENQFRFCFRLRSSVAPCVEESLLSLAKLRLKEVWKSFTEHTECVDVWLKNDSEKVRNSLTWFSHGSGAALAPEPLVRVPFSTTRVFETLFSLNWKE